MFGDGSTWHVPRPTWWRRPVFRLGREVGEAAGFGYGQHHEARIQRVIEAADHEARASAVADLAAALLGANYELDSNELDRLLSFRPDDPASVSWMLRVLEIATGKAELMGGDE